MAIIVDPYVSPRIITVPTADGTTITIQSLLDQIRTWEEVPANLSFPRLARAAGKEDLGGGVQVGITLTLENAKLAFEARGGPSFVQCVVSGGNLVAVDSADVVIDPVQTTAFTQVVIAQSTSASLIEGSGGLTAAEVNAEMVDVMQTDTHAEIGQVAISHPVSYRDMMRVLFKAFVNPQEMHKLLGYMLYNSDGVTIDQKATIADDGTTFVRGKVEKGP